jgi:hypothetical protein
MCIRLVLRLYPGANRSGNLNLGKCPGPQLLAGVGRAPTSLHVVSLATQTCTTALGNSTAPDHSLPLLHVLIAALRVMASLATLPCTIAPGSCSALALWPPFLHTLIMALRVMAPPFHPALHHRAEELHQLRPPAPPQACGSQPHGPCKNAAPTPDLSATVPR